MEQTAKKAGVGTKSLVSKSTVADAPFKGRRSIALAASLVSAGLCHEALGAKAVKIDHVVRGAATLTNVGSKTIIRASDRTIIDFKQFDIAPGESVQFVQPSSHARVLDRITSETPAQINGTLTANGIVYFVDPAGIVFGPHSVVTANQIFAAGGGMSNVDFTSGINRFELTSSVVNNGVINAAAVALAGISLVNNGQVNANGGLVSFAVGNEVYIGPTGDTMTVKVNAATSNANKAAAVSSSGSASMQNNGSVSGGSVSMASGDVFSIALGNAGKITAPRIKVAGGNSASVQVSGSLDASSSKGTGGSVSITGSSISLINASVDATGATGGGSIRVGGDFHGKGTLMNAQTTSVDAGSTLNVSATQAGAGGTVAVWSDGATAVHGTILARGIGADGGYIETSGKATLDVSGITVDASGLHAGTWLLDPGSVTIDPTSNSSGGTFDTTTGLLTAPLTGDSVINAGQITTALLGGTNVTIATGISGVAGLGDGSITVNKGSLSGLTIGNSAKAILTLNAGGAIDVESDITTANNGFLSVLLNAGTSIKVNSAIATGGGLFSAVADSVNFTSNSSISTSGGNFTVQATSGAKLAGAVSTANLKSDGTFNDLGGVVSITSGTAIEIGGNTTTGGGNFTAGGSTFTLDAGTKLGTDTLKNGGGSIQITTMGATSLAGPVTAASGPVTITSQSTTDSIKTTGAGSISTTGSISLTAGANSIGMKIDSGSISGSVTAGGKNQPQCDKQYSWRG